MKYKRNIIYLFHIGMVLAMLTAGFSALDRLTMRKEAAARNEELYEKGPEYDILFVGNSHMVNGVLPLELYHDYGIASYNMGRYGHYIPESFYALEDALQYTDPELVVIDVFMLGRDEKMRNDQIGINFSHTTMDSIPFCLRKVRAVFDLQQEGAFRQELLFPYSVYHNRWDELGEGDFRIDASREKGAVTAREVADYEEEDMAEGAAADDDEDMAGGAAAKVAENAGTGEIYLDRMVAMCRERGIQVLLIYMPFPVNHSDEVLMADRAADQRLAAAYAQEKELPYLNLIDTDIWNPYTDFADKEHVNALGAQKITDFLGSYIRGNYQMADRREDASYAGWGEAFDEYCRIKREALAGEDDLAVYLMLCNDPDFYVTAVADPDFAKDDMTIRELLQGLEEVSYAEETDGIRIRVRDPGTNEIISEKTFGQETAISEREE